MEELIKFINDKVVGIPYFILVSVCVFLIFAIIGYLVSLKYKAVSSTEII